VGSEKFNSFGGQWDVWDFSMRSTAIGVRECIFLGKQKSFAQIWSCFSQITYKRQVLILRLKTYPCKVIKVSACSNYQLTGFRAIHSQLAIHILHSHMWTMVIFIGWKRLANCNKIPPTIAVQATTCSECCSASSFSSFYVRSMLIFSKRSFYSNT